MFAAGRPKYDDWFDTSSYTRPCTQNITSNDILMLTGHHRSSLACINMSLMLFSGYYCYSPHRLDSYSTLHHHLSYLDYQDYTGSQDLTLTT